MNFVFLFTSTGRFLEVMLSKFETRTKALYGFLFVNTGQSRVGNFSVSSSKLLVFGNEFNTIVINSG